MNLSRGKARRIAWRESPAAFDTTIKARNMDAGSQQFVQEIRGDTGDQELELTVDSLSERFFSPIPGLRGAKFLLENNSLSRPMSGKPRPLRGLLRYASLLGVRTMEN